MDALQQTRIRDRWPLTVGEHPVISVDRMSQNEPEITIAVAVHDPMLTWDHWPAHGTSVSALVLTAADDPSRDLMPRPLPDDLVARTIDAVLPVLCSFVPGGHDVLELADLLAAAKYAPNALPLPPAPRAPRNRFERRLRETALRLQSCFAARLEPLHREIAAYGDALLRSGLGPAIDSLSTQGAVADWLSLKPDRSIGGLRMLHDDPRSRHDLLEQHRRATAACTAVNRVLQDIAPYAKQTRWRLSAFHVAELYRVGFAPGRDASIWRRDDPVHSILPYSVPAIGIEAAMLRFVHAYDRRLLGDIDPTIVAALGFFEIMNIAPYGRSDSDVGRLLLQILLRQANLPPMPVPVVLYRRYWEHASTLDDALQRHEPGLLVEATVAALEEAVGVGEVMIRELGKERQHLLALLTEVGVAPDVAANIVSDLQCNALVPRREHSETTPFDVTTSEGLMSHLHAKGLIDLVAAAGRPWWSSAVSRRLVATP
jgi:hypothetical protein